MPENTNNNTPDAERPASPPQQQGPGSQDAARSKADIAAEHTAREAARNAGGGSKPADKAPG